MSEKQTLFLHDRKMHTKDCELVPGYLGTTHWTLNLATEIALGRDELTP